MPGLTDRALAPDRDEAGIFACDAKLRFKSAASQSTDFGQESPLPLVSTTKPLRLAARSSTTGNSRPMILRTASRSRPTMLAQLIADDRVAQRGHRHEQRRRRDPLVDVPASPSASALRSTLSM